LNLTSNTETIKSEAKALGFSFCGISKAEKLEKEASQLEDWLTKGMHGKMGYMENHFDKRVDPRKLVEGAKSVVCLLYNYAPEQELPSEQYKIARYAYGQDYHHVIKTKIAALIENISPTLGQFEGRIFTDSAPVMERQWAAKSGLGWLGKNTLLLNREMGSYFFIATIISDWAFEYDAPIKDYCGTCTACIDACPTQAINPNGYLEANKCISYLTIELKDEIPKEFNGKMDNWMFGCDVCQEVCPWNRFSTPNKESLFQPNEELKGMNDKDWEEITQEVFSKIFTKSAVKRTKFNGLKRNIDILKKR
jgi:epoxyqueuosine reductase